MIEITQKAEEMLLKAIEGQGENLTVRLYQAGVG
jgi:hypothetical protein